MGKHIVMYECFHRSRIVTQIVENNSDLKVVGCIYWKRICGLFVVILVDGVLLNYRMCCDPAPNGGNKICPA